MAKHHTRLSLHTYPHPDYVSLATTFAEEAAKSFGLNREGALKLTLASEEIFMYLCRTGRRDEPLTIEAVDGRYYVEVRFLFKDADFNPRAFNLTARVSVEDRDSLNEMGLLIASRTVDGFQIAGTPLTGLVLALTKEKSYPELDELATPAGKPDAPLVIKATEPEGLKLFSRLLATRYPGGASPPDFRLPGKLVDMVAGGEYGASLATTAEGHPAGGVLWRWLGSKTVESFGPYLFRQPADKALAGELLDSCVGRIAKTDAVGLLHRWDTPEMPPRYFESLGTIDLIEADGATTRRPVYYRHLNEDLGCRVWAHPELEDFLQAEYRRLFFAREIRLIRHGGEQRPPYSVLAVRFDRAQGQATLRAIWDGIDMAENLARHVAVLKAENLRNIFLELDLGSAWQADLIPALGANRFRPRLILPYGGEADLVLFQYTEGG